MCREQIHEPKLHCTSHLASACECDRKHCPKCKAIQRNNNYAPLPSLSLSFPLLSFFKLTVNLLHKHDCANKVAAAHPLPTALQNIYCNDIRRRKSIIHPQKTNNNKTIKITTLQILLVVQPAAPRVVPEQQRHLHKAPTPEEQEAQALLVVLHSLHQAA